MDIIAAPDQAAPYTLSGSLVANVPGPLRSWLSSVLCLSELDRIYAAAPEQAGQTFAERVLRSLCVDVDIDTVDLERLPANGPVIVIANNPFGFLDGIMLDAVVSRVRKICGCSST